MKGVNGNERRQRMLKTLYARTAADPEKSPEKSTEQPAPSGPIRSSYRFKLWILRGFCVYVDAGS